MITVHLKKLRQRIDISSDEERAIRDSVAEVRRIAAGKVVIRAGEELSSSLMLIDGWMARSKDLAGGERQVTQLHVAGDFADLHGFTLKHLDDDITTLSDCRIATVPHERIREITQEYPRLGRIFWFSTNMDAAIQRELVLSLGQRSAISRMAHLFCELYVRLGVVGKTSTDGYEFPLTQRELSECLGLTVVHANRTLQELRRRGLVELENRKLTIADRRGLEGVAEFDPSYLYLDRHCV
ncbi:MAG TPA: Crp/Fnr family transcriptional regulator [Sphingomicrobium sp.]|jgi:CRP-like cAMP-binding protein|nr:Crp/Fnr family transcriptional regulator [Sphingomicrobium sp.]